MRAGFDSSSAQIGTLERGEEIDVIASRVNGRGQLRVQLSGDGGGAGGGWTSVQASDGATLLDPMSIRLQEEGPGGNSAGVLPRPQLYRALARAAIRVGADPSSANAGVLEVGEFISVLETRQLASRPGAATTAALGASRLLRARFVFTGGKKRLGRTGGWTSVRAADGELLLECIQTNDTTTPTAADAADADAQSDRQQAAERAEPEPEPQPPAEGGVLCDQSENGDDGGSESDSDMDCSSTSMARSSPPTEATMASAQVSVAAAVASMMPVVVPASSSLPATARVGAQVDKEDDAGGADADAGAVDAGGGVQTSASHNLLQLEIRNVQHAICSAEAQVCRHCHSSDHIV